MVEAEADGLAGAHGEAGGGLTEGGGSRGDGDRAWHGAEGVEKVVRQVEVDHGVVGVCHLRHDYLLDGGLNVEGEGEDGGIHEGGDVRGVQGGGAGEACLCPVVRVRGGG